jgi:hypothetical protein
MTKLILQLEDDFKQAKSGSIIKRRLRKQLQNLKAIEKQFYLTASMVPRHKTSERKQN